MAIDYFFDETIKKYKQEFNKELFVDANLMLLYLIGELDVNFIKNFSRTTRYSIGDYKNVKKIIEQDFSHNLMTTPNVLTEVNNLANKLNRDKKYQFIQLFSHMIGEMKEIYQASNDFTNTYELEEFGLIDAIIIQMTKKYNLLLLTDDFKLSAYIGEYALNIYHTYRPNNSNTLINS